MLGSHYLNKDKSNGPLPGGRCPIRIYLLPVKASNAEATYFHPKHKEEKISENHLNPVMLVFI